MATFCLIPEQVQKFKQALKDRTIDPAKLGKMTSSERREFLEKIVGKENGMQVNALFESKLLLKNQKAGYITWAKKVSGISPQAKRDLISRIERMDKVLSPDEEQTFLRDLAEAKLGFGVTEQEAKTIAELSMNLKQARAKMKPDFTWETKADGEKFGATKLALEKYVGEMKKKARGSDFVNPLKGLGAIGQDLGATIKLIAQNTRAFVASFDNSLWGNQGIRVALDRKFTGIWARNFTKSFKDIAKTLVKGKKAGDEILDATKAEIYARKNSLNGRYEMNTRETSKLDLGGLEEEFPTSLPSRIPVVGRFFKASEVAYEAGAMRLRADIADKVYAMAEKQGVNMLDKFEVGSRNVVINSITGRGRIKVPDLINDAVFSIKFFKSQLDFLTVNAFDKLSPSARKLAAGNILNVVASTAIILGIAKALDPKSTDFDPRGTRFGKIEKDGITLINLTPGYGSMITLISRILTQSTKNKAGIVKKLGEEYGVPNGMDVFWNYTENKASPIAAIIRDLIRQRTFEGDKPTDDLGKFALDSITSISLDSAREILADKSGDSLLKAIAIGLGILGTGAGSTYYPVKWENSTGKELTQFREKVGDEKFKEANEKFNTNYEAWLKETQQKPAFKELSDEEKQDVITKAKDSIKQAIFKSYNFKYKTEKKSSSEKQKIKDLLPK